ncbi:MAG: hypothetical protein WC520_02990 [Candidatus Paceibacterota bacterium]
MRRYALYYVAAQAVVIGLATTCILLTIFVASLINDFSAQAIVGAVGVVLAITVPAYLYFDLNARLDSQVKKEYQRVVDANVEH